MYQNVQTINRLKNPMLLIVLLLSNPWFMVIDAIIFHENNNSNSNNNNNNHDENPTADSPESDSTMFYLIKDLYPDIDDTKIDDTKQNNFLKMIETPSLLPTSATSSSSPSSTSELIPSLIDPPSLMHVVQTRGANKQHLCGDFLVKALALSCNGRYNKRNSIMAFGNKINNEKYNDYKYKNEDTIHKNEILLKNLDHQEYESSNPSKTYGHIEFNQHLSGNGNQIDAKELNWLILLNSLKNVPSTSSSFASTPSSFSSSLLSTSSLSSIPMLQGISSPQTQSQLSSSSSSSSSSSLKNHRRIQKRGVVEECCKHPCGLSTLRQYCATPPKPVEKD